MLYGPNTPKWSKKSKCVVDGGLGTISLHQKNVLIGALIPDNMEISSVPIFDDRQTDRQTDRKAPIIIGMGRVYFGM